MFDSYFASNSVNKGRFRFQSGRTPKQLLQNPKRPFRISKPPFYSVEANFKKCKKEQHRERQVRAPSGKFAHLTPSSRT